jgi:hypothetical protein
VVYSLRTVYYPRGKEHEVFTRTMRSLVILTATGSALCAAALTMSAVPASATSVAWFYGAAYNQEIICTPPTTHGLESASARGFVAASNGCSTRVWLHQFSDGSGWSYCISPNKYVTIPDWAQFPEQALVSENTAPC